MWGRRTGTDRWLPFMTYFGAVLLTLEKHLKGQFLPLSCEANLSYNSTARGILKKALAKSSKAWYTSKTVIKVSKMVTILGTSAWMDGGRYLV